MHLIIFLNISKVIQRQFMFIIFTFINRMQTHHPTTDYYDNPTELIQSMSQRIISLKHSCDQLLQMIKSNSQYYDACICNHQIQMASDKLGKQVSRKVKYLLQQKIQTSLISSQYFLNGDFELNIQGIVKDSYLKTFDSLKTKVHRKKAIDNQELIKIKQKLTSYQNQNKLFACAEQRQIVEIPIELNIVKQSVQMQIQTEIEAVHEILMTMRQWTLQFKPQVVEVPIQVIVQKTVQQFIQVPVYIRQIVQIPVQMQEIVEVIVQSEKQIIEIPVQVESVFQVPVEIIIKKQCEDMGCQTERDIDSEFQIYEIPVEVQLMNLSINQKRLSQNATDKTVCHQQIQTDQMNSQMKIIQVPVQMQIFSMLQYHNQSMGQIKLDEGQKVNYMPFNSSPNSIHQGNNQYQQNIIPKLQNSEGLKQLDQQVKFNTIFQIPVQISLIRQSQNVQTQTQQLAEDKNQNHFQVLQVPVQIFTEKIVEVIVEKQVYITEYVQIPIQVFIQKIVQVPIFTIQEKIRQVPVQVILQKNVEVVINQKQVVQIPVQVVLERVVQVPTYSLQNNQQNVSKLNSRQIQQNTETQQGKKQQQIYIQKIVEVPVEVFIQVIKEKIVQVPVYIYEKQIVEIPIQVQINSKVETDFAAEYKSSNQIPVQTQIINEQPQTQAYNVYQKQISPKFYNQISRSVQEKQFIQIPVQVYIQKIVQVVVQKFIEVPVEIFIQKIVQVPIIVKQKQFIQVPVEIYVQKRVQIPIIQKQFIEIPTQIIIQKIVEVPTFIREIVQMPVQLWQQKIIQVPVKIYQKQFIEIPTEVIVEKYIQVPVVSSQKQFVQIPVEVYIQKIVEVPTLINQNKPLLISTQLQQIARNQQIISDVEYQNQNQNKKLKSGTYNENQVQNQQIIQKKDQIIEIPVQVYIQKLVEVPITQKVFVQIPVEVQIQKIVEVPVFIYQKQFIEVPVQVIVEKIVEVIIEKIVQVPVIIYQKQFIEVPVELITQVPIQIQKLVETVVQTQKIVQVPVQVIIQKIVEVLVQTQKIVQVPVQVVVQRIVQVLVQNVKIVEIPVEIISQKYVQVPVQKIVKEFIQIPVQVQLFKQISQKQNGIFIYNQEFSKNFKSYWNLLPNEDKKELIQLFNQFEKQRNSKCLQMSSQSQQIDNVLQNYQNQMKMDRYKLQTIQKSFVQKTQSFQEQSKNQINEGSEPLKEFIEIPIQLYFERQKAQVQEIQTQTQEIQQSLHHIYQIPVQLDVYNSEPRQNNFFQSQINNSNQQHQFEIYQFSKSQVQIYEVPVQIQLQKDVKNAEIQTETQAFSSEVQPILSINGKELQCNQFKLQQARKKLSNHLNIDESIESQKNTEELNFGSRNLTINDVSVINKNTQNKQLFNSVSDQVFLNTKKMDLLNKIDNSSFSDHASIGQMKIDDSNHNNNGQINLLRVQGHIPILQENTEQVSMTSITSGHQIQLKEKYHESVEMFQFQQKIGEMKQQNQKLHNYIQTLNQQLKLAILDNKKLEQQISNKQKKNLILQHQNQINQFTFNNQIQQIQQEKNILQQKIYQIKKNYDLTLQKSETLQSKYQQLKNKHQDLKTEIQQQIRGSTTQIQRLNQNLSDKCVLLTQMKIEQNHSKLLFQEQILSLREENQKKKLLIEQYQKQIFSKNERLFKLGQSHEEMRKSITTNGEISTTELYQKQFTRIKDQFQEQIQLQIQKNVQLSRINQALVEDITALKQKNIGLERMISQAQQRYFTFKEINQRQLRQSQTKLYEIQNEYHTKIQQLQQANYQLRQQLILKQSQFCKIANQKKTTKIQVLKGSPNNNNHSDYQINNISRSQTKIQPILRNQIMINKSIQNSLSYSHALEQVTLKYQKIIETNQQMIDQLQDRVYEYLKDALEKQQEAESLYIKLCDYQNTINGILVQKITIELQNKRLRKMIVSSEKKLALLGNQLIKVARQSADVQSDEDLDFFQH